MPNKELAIEATQRTEVVPIWVGVGVQQVALQGEDEDALPPHLTTAALTLVSMTVLFDEVQAVLDDAKAFWLLPLARDGAAVLAGEREDMQR